MNENPGSDTPDVYGALVDRRTDAGERFDQDPFPAELEEFAARRPARRQAHSCRRRCGNSSKYLEALQLASGTYCDAVELARYAPPHQCTITSITETSKEPDRKKALDALSATFFCDTKHVLARESELHPHWSRMPRS